MDTLNPNAADFDGVARSAIRVVHCGHPRWTASSQLDVRRIASMVMSSNGSAAPSKSDKRSFVIAVTAHSGPTPLGWPHHSSLGEKKWLRSEMQGLRLSPSYSWAFRAQHSLASNLRPHSSPHAGATHSNCAADRWPAWTALSHACERKSPKLARVAERNMTQKPRLLGNSRLSQASVGNCLLRRWRVAASCGLQVGRLGPGFRAAFENAFEDQLTPARTDCDRAHNMTRPRGGAPPSISAAPPLSTWTRPTETELQLPLLSLQ